MFGDKTRRNMKLFLFPCMSSLILSGCQVHADASRQSSELSQQDKMPVFYNPLRASSRWPAYDPSVSPSKLSPYLSTRTDKENKQKTPLKNKKHNKASSKKWKRETKYDASELSRYRTRRDTSDNQVDGDFARVLDRVITLTAPKARSRLQTLWKRLRSVLFASKSDGTNGERADELTKALFQQLFKQFDLPAILRKRADKLRRRVGPSGAAQASNSTGETQKKDDTVKVVDFRKKSEESKSGDQQIQQWLDMVAEGDTTLAQKEKIDVDGADRSSTTAAPTSSTRYPQLSLFQRRKGPVQVSVKIPQKHAKAGIKRFSPAQGRAVSSSF